MALKHHNRCTAAAFQKARLRDPNHSLAPEYLGCFFAHAKTAFSYNYPDLEDAFYHFFQCTRFLALAEIAVHKLLEDNPRLGQLLLRKMWTEGGEGVCLTSIPTECDDCGKSVSELRNGFIRHSRISLVEILEDFEVIDASIEGVCNECYRK